MDSLSLCDRSGTSQPWREAKTDWGRGLNGIGKCLVSIWGREDRFPIGQAEEAGNWKATLTAHTPSIPNYSLWTTEAFKDAFKWKKERKFYLKALCTIWAIKIVSQQSGILSRCCSQQEAPGFISQGWLVPLLCGVFHDCSVVSVVSWHSVNYWFEIIVSLHDSWVTCSGCTPSLPSCLDSFVMSFAIVIFWLVFP